MGTYSLVIKKRNGNLFIIKNNLIDTVSKCRCQTHKDNCRNKITKASLYGINSQIAVLTNTDTDMDTDLSLYKDRGHDDSQKIRV